MPPGSFTPPARMRAARRRRPATAAHAHAHAHAPSIVAHQARMRDEQCALSSHAAARDWLAVARALIALALTLERERVRAALDRAPAPVIGAKERVSPRWLPPE